MSTPETPNPPKRPIVVSSEAWEIAKKMSRALDTDMGVITAEAIHEKFHRLTPEIREAIINLEAARAKAA